MPRDWQIIAAESPPLWQGDLENRCTALWAGLVLHARLVHYEDGDEWLYSVYDEENDIQIAHSVDDEKWFTNGEAARNAAEAIAREYLR